MATVLIWFLVLIDLLSYGRAGKQCYSCDRIPLPSDCSHVIMCGDHEDCVVTQYVSEGGHVYFDTGCIDRSKCFVSKRGAHNSVQVSGRSASDIIVCSECCSAGFCNTNGCGSKPPPSQSSRGPLCYSCPVEVRPENCETIASCSLGHFCELERYVNGINGETRYRSGCKSQAECSNIVDGHAVLVGKRGLTKTACCSTDYCNRDFQTIAMSGHVVSPTHATTTTQHPPTTARTTTAVITSQPMTSTTTEDPEIHREQLCVSLGYTYLPHLSSCVKFFTTEKLSWADAQLRCQADGGDLAIFRSLGEETAVQQWLETHIGDKTLIQFYVGATDHDNEAVWTWVDGSEVDSSLWRPYEPSSNHHDNTDEDCATMFARYGEPILLNDDSCEQPQHFICGKTSPDLSMLGASATSQGLCRNAGYAQNAELGMCYKVYDTTAVTQQKAHMLCQSDGAELLQLRDKHTEDFFRNLAYKDRTNDHNRYWLGAHKRSADGQFYWFNGHRVGDNTTLVWDLGEPNNYEGHEECLDFKYSNEPQQPDIIALNDDNCDHNYYFICEERCPNKIFQYFPALDLCFHVVEGSPLTWDEARKYCHKHNAELMEPTTLNTIEMLNAYRKLKNISSHQFWVGSRLGSNQQFNWLVSGGHVTADLWHSGEPSTTRTGEECVSLELWKNDDLLRLNDLDCNTNQLSFICEYVW